MHCAVSINCSILSKFKNFKIMSFTFILVVLYCAVLTQAKELPDFIHVCKRNDPELNACLIRAAEDLKPILAAGNAEYNIPSLEPLSMDELIRDKQGNLQVTATNVKAYGSSNYFMKDLKYDINTHRFDIDVELPNLLIEAEYTIDGKVLLLPIKGSGPMNANVTDVFARVVLQGETNNIDGTDYLSFTSMTIKVTVGAGTGRLDNLFNGDKVLGDIINDTINKNMDAFLKELLPIIEKNLAKEFIQIANNIVTPFTYDQLFSDN